MLNPDHIRLGRNKDRAGINRSMAITTTSESKNTATPLKIVSRPILFPTIDLMTKTFSPMGGVTKPTSSNFTTITPNQIRLRPYPSIIGRVTGKVSKMMPMGSMNMPSMI